MHLEKIVNVDGALTAGASPVFSSLGGFTLGAAAPGPAPEPTPTPKPEPTPPSSDFKLPIFGGAGRDTLLGGDGDDVLFDGAGADRLSSGFGGDSFVFGAGDRVEDFDAGEGDVIVFEAALGLISADVTVTQVSYGATISAAGVAGSLLLLQYFGPVDLGSDLRFDYLRGFEFQQACRRRVSGAAFRPGHATPEAGVLQYLIWETPDLPSQSA